MAKSRNGPDRSPRHVTADGSHENYYGSMAAGSIVGSASRTREDGAPRNNRHGNSANRAVARRDERRNHGRVDHSCRATLVQPCEGTARVDESCFGIGGLPLLDTNTLSGPFDPASMLLAARTRAVWLVLTTNSVALYDSASRRKRLATYALRRLCVVLPAPFSSPATESISPPHFGVLCGFLPILTATTRPPPLPATVATAPCLSVATLYFDNAEAQARWLQKLCQAAAPKQPEIISRLPSHACVHVLSDGHPTRLASLSISASADEALLREASTPLALARPLPPVDAPGTLAALQVAPAASEQGTSTQPVQSLIRVRVPTLLNAATACW